MSRFGVWGRFRFARMKPLAVPLFNQALALPAAMRFVPRLALIAAPLALSGCGSEPSDVPLSPVNEADPYIARALNDPLMVDPDLSYRNEANAAITLGYDHALPSFKGTEEAASRARETARLELLEKGPLEDLPFPSDTPGPTGLAEAFGTQAVMRALDLPSACTKDIRGDFALAANLPDIARVMPHGMVRVAAAVEQSGCTMRMVRYVTPVPVDDALQYHFNIMARADFEPDYFADPEKSLIARRRGVNIAVFARETSGDLSAVDVVTWKEG